MINSNSAPSTTLGATLKQLRAARKSMLSTSWTLKMAKQPPDTRRTNRRELARTNLAIRKLENKQLAEIRDKLVANETALLQGITDLEGKLQDLSKVKAVLTALTGVLNIVGRVVTLVT